MMQAFLVALVSILPIAEPTRDGVAVLEKNIVYDGCGRITFEQWVFWRGTGDSGDVRAWRIAKPWHLPTRDHRHGGYVLRFWDGEIFREIRAVSYRVRHTQFDTEQKDRDYLPKEKRVGLAFEE